MKSDSRQINWRYVAEAIAVLSVLVTLIFVIYELRLIRTIATVEGVGLARELSSFTSQLITENPDIWYRGCVGEELEDHERVVFYQIAFSVYQRVNFQWFRTNQGMGNPYQLERLPTLLALNMYYFPGFNRAMEERFGLGIAITPEDILGGGQEEIEDGFRASVVEKLEFIRETNLEMDADAMICGT